MPPSSVPRRWTTSPSTSECGPAPLSVQNLTNLFIIDKGWIAANGVETPQDCKAGEEKFTVRSTNGTGP
jgi:peptide/nickel transport system substrate-binding protein